MLENLKATKYNDGTDVPLIIDNSAWDNLTTPGYCWYNNDASSYEATYGALYNWYAVDTRKLCPAGWHVPSLADWAILINYLGGESIADGKLKEKGLSHWFSPNTGATNVSGFTALPACERNNLGEFNYNGAVGNLWSSNADQYGAHYYMINYDADPVVTQPNFKNMGFSVRCIKDN
jgi:uncharacterized protein (TIGR02145 family)